MTSDKVADRVELLIDELVEIKNNNKEFDFALAVSWEEPGTLEIKGDCVVTDMITEKFRTILENLVITFEKKGDESNYYGNVWHEDRTIN